LKLEGVAELAGRESLKFLRVHRRPPPSWGILSPRE
jgi:hypothetical protein